MLGRESGGGQEERKMGSWDPSGNTYMKATLCWWCVLKKWGMRFEQVKKRRPKRASSLELQSFPRKKFLQENLKGT
jgi:hypothetical protein